MVSPGGGGGGRDFPENEESDEALSLEGRNGACQGERGREREGERERERERKRERE